MVFKMKYKLLGAHYHCRLFVARAPNMTYAFCGALKFALNDWTDVQLAMSGVAFQDEGD